MKRLIATLIFVSVPCVTLANTPTQASITRRDGFLMLWESIKRPAEPAKGLFADVPEVAKGSLEIDYARARGIVDEAENFFPDKPLLLRDALIWMFRMNNIMDDPDEVNDDTLSSLLARYPVARLSAAEQNTATVTAEQITRMVTLLASQLRQEQHEVSLYAEKFHGDGTAFGETFDMHALTAAHRSYPHNTLVRVTNVRNGKSVVVRINDRGPYVHGRNMDLSLAAFTSIEDRSKGKFIATFERLGDSRLVQAELPKSTSVPVSVVACAKPVMQRRVGGGLALKNGVPSHLALGDTITLDAPKPFIIRGIHHPDGTKQELEDVVRTRESFSFTPTAEGRYKLLIAPARGRTVTLAVQVARCAQ